MCWQKPCFPEVGPFFCRRFVFVLAILATVVKPLPQHGGDLPSGNVEADWQGQGHFLRSIFSYMLVLVASLGWGVTRPYLDQPTILKAGSHWCSTGSPSGWAVLGGPGFVLLLHRPGLYSRVGLVLQVQKASQVSQVPSDRDIWDTQWGFHGSGTATPCP